MYGIHHPLFLFLYFILILKVHSLILFSEISSPIVNKHNTSLPWDI